MAIGNYYPVSSSVVDADLFLGTKAGSNNTVNYTAQTVVDYLNTNSKVSIGGQLSFQFVEVPNVSKTISFPAGGGDNTLFSSITQLIVSTSDLGNANVVAFLNYLNGSEILLAQQNQPSTFGHYKITGYTVTVNPNFYTLTLQFIGGNGNITKNTYYDLSSFVLSSGGNIPTKTSDLINDGDDGINPFISALALTPYLLSTTAASTYYPLVGNPSNFITSAALTPYLLSTVAASTYYPIPTGTTSQYIRGDGSLATFPTSSTPTLNQVLTAGNVSLLDAKIGVLYGYDNNNADYGTLEFYDSGVVLKAATTNKILFYNDGLGSVTFSNGGYNPILNFAGVGNNLYTFQNANGTLAFLSDIPSLAGYVPTSRTLTINGTTYDLSSNRTWSVGTVTSVGATGPITSTGGNTPVISTSMATNKLIGRSTAGTGVMEEITIGSGLTLSAGALSATLTGYVPYTGATGNVDLGTHTLLARDLVINHPSGSGVAASITKGGSGEALTVLKTSGSGNAASILGGVTLIDELHLNTDLSDAYIASAATWNAKQNAITLTTTGTSGPATLVGATLNIPQYSGGSSGILGIHAIFPLTSGASITSAVNSLPFTSANLISNRLYAMPFNSAQSFTTSSLYINCSTLQASALARILIYSDLNGLPDQKLYESSNLDLSTTGIKTASTTFTITAGTTYWLCVHSFGTAALSHIQTGASYPLRTSGSSINVLVYGAPTFGSAPTTFPFVSYSSSVAPMVGLTKV